MTVKELMEFLETQPPNTRVLCYDPLALRTEDVEVYNGFASPCFDKLFPVGCKDEALQLAEEKSKEEEERSGVPLVDVESEVFYCVAFAPYYDPAIKELANKRNFSDPDLLMKSYIENPIMPFHIDGTPSIAREDMDIIIHMEEDEFQRFLDSLTDDKTIPQVLEDLGYKNGLSDEQQEEI